uniref:C2H2-type domain-containing protein n=1 Tax=Ananas comosus var. bracteatus TaxID=296719 RepID=A0A6V7QC97_ANACO|nr:unnamed protein product [Ananas comosus var. bracteatus]
MFESSSVQELVPIDQSVDDLRNLDSVVNQLLLLADKLPLMPVTRQQPQSDDGGNSENNITSDNSTARGSNGNGSGSGSSRKVIMKDGLSEPANIGVVAGGKKGRAKKKRSSISAIANSGVHTCEKCGMTFATGQLLGGHMRKHYEGPPIINKKRSCEQWKKMLALAVELRVQELVAPIGHTMAMMTATEERMASYFNTPLESHNPELLSQSTKASDGGDYAMNREEPEGLSASNGARRLHDFDLNVSARPKEEPENVLQPQSERKDDDGNNALLSFRLGHFDF